MPPPLRVHIQRGTQHYGPYPLDQVTALLAERRLQLGDIAWLEGVTERQPLAVLLQAQGIAVPPPENHAGLKWVVPVGRSPWAIAAGYAGLFAVLAIPAPLALLLGLVALRDLQRHPDRGGRGRAWFGVIMGILGSALLLFFAIAAASR